MAEDNRGRFKFDFSGGGPLARKLGEKIIQADWISELDKSDVLKVRIALTKAEALQFKLADLPTKVNLNWQDRPIFKGGIVSAKKTDHSAVELSFRDNLFALERIVDVSHLKTETLANALKTIFGKAKLDVRFFGDFGESLPTIFLGGRNLFETLSFLSEQFGFFFYYHAPSALVHLLRLDASSSKVSVDVQKSVTRMQSNLRSDLSWNGVETRVFNDQDLSTQNRKIPSQSLYSALSGLTEHAGYRGKQAWPFANGEYEVHAPNLGEYNDSERRFKHPLAKKAVFSESVTLRSYSPLALPGDQVELKNTLTPALHEGKFLLQRCHATFASSLPRVDLTLIRP